jgi:hypothetical protein
MPHQYNARVSQGTSEAISIHTVRLPSTCFTGDNPRPIRLAGGVRDEQVAPEIVDEDEEVANQREHYGLPVREVSQASPDRFRARLGSA